MTVLRIEAPDGIGEVRPGDDLAAIVLTVLEPADGDVIVVTSKVVSKAEGRLHVADRDEVLEQETVRVVARRGPVRIVENRLGLVMAAGGIDNSNVTAGSVATLPRDPDASARRLRDELHQRTGRNVAVLISDTAGRAWRLGQTDIAIGAAGLAPLDSFAGRTDSYGNALAVTEPAVADELAGAAELASGKLGGRPVVLVRGLADLVLPVGEDGPGARSMVRPGEQDMFALGTREAVVAAVAGEDPGAFGPPAPPEDLADALARCGVVSRPHPRGLEVLDRASAGPDAGQGSGAAAWALAVLTTAHGWQVTTTDTTTVLTPGRTPAG